MRRRRWRWQALVVSWLAALAAGLPACAPEAAPTLELRRFAQEGAQDVLLNQPLVFEFDRDVDPYSVGVSCRAIEILGADGEPAVGRFSVERDTVRFLPRLASRFDLADSGLQPATTYRVTVNGGLALDAPQAAQGGQRLARARRFSFRTVAATARRCFVDTDAPGRPRLREAAGADVEPGGAFVLEFSRHLDPRTVDPSALEVRLSEGGRQGGVLRVTGVELRQTSTGSVMRVATDPPPGQGATYSVRVSDSVLDMGGMPCSATATYFGRDA